MRIKNNSGINTINDLCCFIFLFPIVLSAAFPAFTSYGNNALICLVCEIMWLFFAYTKSRMVIKNIVNSIWYMFFYMAYVAVIPYIMGNPAIGNRYMYTFILIFGVIITLFYYETNNMKLIGSAIFCCSPFFVYTFVKTIQSGINNPYIMRSIDTNEAGYALMRQGIGGYHFVYMVSIISVLSFILFLKSSGIKKYIYLVISSICLFLIILSNFFTAVVMSLVGIAIALFMRFSRKRIINGIVVAVLFLFLYYVAQKYFLIYFVELFDDGGRIYNVIGSGESIGSSLVSEFIRDRWPTIQISLEAYINHPIFGLSMGTIENNGVYDISYGQHSYIADSLALFGTIFGGMSIIAMFLAFRKIQFLKEEKDFYIPLFMLTIIVSLFNNLTHSVAVCITIICPYFIYNLRECKEKTQYGDQL